MSDLSALHTFAFSASCQKVFPLDCETALNTFVNSIAKGPEPWWLIGEGSNTIFTEDFAGVVVKMALKGIELETKQDAYLLSVGAGESWHGLVTWCMQQNIYGFENLALIPGTVGAAPIQNIGAYGVEIAQFIERVEYIDLDKAELNTLNRDECHFSYRDSIFKQALAGKALITKVHFSLLKASKVHNDYAPLNKLVDPTAQHIFDKVVEVRQSKLPDPSHIPNAGSFFKNPVVSNIKAKALQQNFPTMPIYSVNHAHSKLAAGWLIDHLGFKGQARGGIVCHAKQALVLTNDGSGTGQQLLGFAREIQHAVYEAFEVQLENEVRLVGQQGLIEL